MSPQQRVAMILGQMIIDKEFFADQLAEITKERDELKARLAKLEKPDAS